MSIPVHSLRVQIVGGPRHSEQTVAKEERLTVGSAAGNDLVLEDETVSRYHLQLERAEHGIVVTDHGSTNGTHLGSVRIERATVPLGTELRVGRCSLRVLDGEEVLVDIAPESQLGELAGSTQPMRRLFARTRKVAKSHVSVLLIGESGTGKELIARALHDESDRAEQPFVTVDCASLMPTLMASELFGHEKGAFTGAHQRHIGAFERANGGTLFLDEIGELPEALQSNLLGVLERRRFRRLGGREEIDVDVRLVCATNRDLRARVNADSFRLDLYFRIAVVRLEVPPLRERPDDIPLLIAHFLTEVGDQRSAAEFLASVPSDLLRHAWPGNVRELRNFVEASAALGEAPELEELAVGTAQGDFGLLRSAFLSLPYKEARALVLKRFEAHYLPHILERANGNVSQAARTNAMDRSHLTDLLHRHGLR